MNELISVIIPVYNVQQFLDEAIKSVIHQTYTNLEIILVDDGSTDASGRLCDDYARLDSRIKVIHTENGGLSKARNCGLDLITGSYVIFLDSDDYYEPNALEVLYNNLIDYTADMSVGSIRDIDEQGKELFLDLLDLKDDVVAMSERDFWAFSLTKKVGVMATSKLYKREIWQTVRFRDGKIHEDDAALVDVLRRCSTIVCTNAVCMNYRIREGSIMQTSFSLKSFDKADFLQERINYFLEQNFYEYCYGTFFAGIELIVKAYLAPEPALKSRAKSVYQTYRKLAIKILPKVNHISQKIYLLLFCCNLKLYITLRYKICGKEL